MKNIRRTEEKVNAIVDEILDEDQENGFGATQAETCLGGCEKLDDTPKETPRQCKCAVENSSRFSLRVMEAMRSLQRDVDQPSTSTAEEIADYIRSHYRYDGDLYAQVRTALRQVCSQGFVMQLLRNEYHLIGPVASPRKRNGCSVDCKGRAIDDTLRSVNDKGNDVCGCARFRGIPIADGFEATTGPAFHSTRISAGERDSADHRDREFGTEELSPLCDCEDASDIRDDRRRRDTVETRGVGQRNGYAEPIPGPSRGIVRVPSPARRNAKKARVGDRPAQRADEKDDGTTMEEDADCTCDADVATRDEHSRIRPPDRVTTRNGRRRDDVEEDEEDERRRVEEEDQEEDQEEDEEEDEGEKAEEEEDDEGTEDSAYRELRARGPRRRTTARERELKRWIRRCRQECERRGGRRRG